MCLLFRSVVALGVALWEEHNLRLLAYRILRRLSGRQREKVTEAWEKIFNCESLDMQVSPYDVTVIKLRRMR